MAVAAGLLLKEQGKLAMEERMRYAPVAPGSPLTITSVR